MLENRTSRRNFLKAGVGLALGLTLAPMERAVAFASSENLEKTAQLHELPMSHFDYKTVSIKALPDPYQAARESDMVKASFQCILDVVKTIRNGSLRASVLGLLKDPNPTVAEQYTTTVSVQNLYNRLVDARYIQSSDVPIDKLVPPYTGKAPQAFYTAPGSGYHSHHAYPGGLATHVASNMLITESIVRTYRTIFGYDAGLDMALAGQALHDICKPWIFQWQDSGESLKEFVIAGTGAHHIYSIAESMYRTLPAEEVIAQACAHDHPGNVQSESSVVNWIKAAALIANVDPVAYGCLTRDGNSIPSPHKQAGYIVHLGDHDFVLSVSASQKVELALRKIAQIRYGLDADKESKQFNYFRNFICSQVSSMLLHNLLSDSQGYQKVDKLVASLVTL